MKTMNDLFLHVLKDIYYAEKQILKALPKMEKAAETPELRVLPDDDVLQRHGHRLLREREPTPQQQRADPASMTERYLHAQNKIPMTRFTCWAA